MSGFTHSTVARPNGWWGVALLVATEAALFGTLLASYFYLRFGARVWPPAGIEAPDIVLPLCLTGALLATAAPLFFAARAARAGNVGRTRLLIALALLVQGGYIAVQVILFQRDLGDFSPSETAYGSVYFTMLATHHAHVVLGMLLELAILAKLLGGLTTYRVTGVRVTALYWYFVVSVAVLVVLTQVSPSL
jgi:heme/copper-type cytochrome/quinol oxidase subunit 3